MIIYDISLTQLDAFNEKHNSQKVIELLLKKTGQETCTHVIDHPRKPGQFLAQAPNLQVLTTGTHGNVKSFIQQNLWGESLTKEGAFSDMYTRIKNPSLFIHSGYAAYNKTELATCPTHPSEEKARIILNPQSLTDTCLVIA